VSTHGKPIKIPLLHGDRPLPLHRLRDVCHVSSPLRSRGTFGQNLRGLEQSRGARDVQECSILPIRGKCACTRFDYPNRRLSALGSQSLFDTSRSLKNACRQPGQTPFRSTGPDEHSYRAVSHIRYRSCLPVLAALLNLTDSEDRKEIASFVHASSSPV